jgi:hypothetical protein
MKFKALVKFVGIAAGSLSCSGLVAEPVPSNWKFRENPDPIMGRVDGSAALTSEDGASKLVINCNGVSDRYVSLQYITPKYLGSTDGVVIVRVDDQVPLPSSTWTYSSKGAYTVSSAVIKLFISMVGETENRIYLRALNYEHQPVDALFHSVNARAAYARVRSMCTDAPLEVD